MALLEMPQKGIWQRAAECARILRVRQRIIALSPIDDLRRASEYYQAWLVSALGLHLSCQPGLASQAGAVLNASIRNLNMGTKSKAGRKLRPHDVRKPPLERPQPPGVNDEPAKPEGVELQAQRLVHEAGSAEEAKKVIDTAVARETKSDFRQDSFAARWGFASRADLLAVSRPLFNDEQSNWWATELPSGEWVVWGDDDLSANTKFASLEDARKAVGDREQD